MAIQWAIKKCEFYLRGLPTFDVLTDHRPLVGIFRKQLSMLENNRLMRMREKIIEFTFEVKWVEGKTHYIADALSRAPVFTPEEEEFTIDCAITHCRQVKERSEIMHTFAGLQQEEYTQLIEATLQGKEFSKLPLTQPARAYKSIADRISVSTTGTTDVAMLDRTIIIVPPNAIQSIMKELHRAHSGIEKMYKTAVQLYFWPGMKKRLSKL